MRIFTGSHLYVVRLMVRTDCHNAEEPEAKDAGKLLFGLDLDAHGRSVRGRFSSHRPSSCQFQHR